MPSSLITAPSYRPSQLHVLGGRLFCFLCQRKEHLQQKDETFIIDMIKLRTILVSALLAITACSVKTENKNQSSVRDSSGTEQAVMVYFQYGIQGLDSLFALEDKLEDVIEQHEAGEYDGHEIATDYTDGVLYMYGPDADSLYKVVKPVLEQTSFMKGAKVKLRYGPAEEKAKEVEMELK
jgi:hypothetical protein